jgi:transposase
MWNALKIRDDLSAEEIRRLARKERQRRPAMRMLAVANALDGMSRAEAAQVVGMDRQALRDVVVRYNAEGVAGFYDRPKPGRSCQLSEGEQAALKALVLRGPNAEKEGISRYTLADICDLAEDRFGVRYAETSMGRLLKRLGLTLQKARPVHPKTDPQAQERFKKGA